MKQLGKFLRLPSSDRYLLATAAILLAAIKMGLRLLPFKTLRALLATMSEKPRTLAQESPCSVDRVVWAVETAARHVPKSTCLTQAIATKVLLARRGFPAHLHIGVAHQGKGEQLLAHAWIESEGKVLIGGSELERYTPLLTLEGQGR